MTWKQQLKRLEIPNQLNWKQSPIIIALVLLAILGASGLAVNPSITTNAFYIYPPGSAIKGTEPVLDTTNKTQVSCTPQTNRTAVIVVIGQSLSTNEVPKPYTPVHDVDQINIYDGNCYKAADPLLGINISDGPVTAQRGTWMSRMADNLITDGKFDRVILVPMAVAETTVGLWASDTTPPYLKNNINVVALRLAQAKLSCTAIMWGQGESDTKAGTSQASYTASLNKVIAEFNRVMPSCPILVARESYYFGATSPAVLAAQDAAPNGTSVFAGENVELIPPSGRYDNTHLNEAGAAQRAALAESALVTALGI